MLRPDARIGATYGDEAPVTGPDERLRITRRQGDT
jgi:hypothetical protein